MVVQFGAEDVWDYGVEHRAVVHKDYPDVALHALQMVQCSVKVDIDGIVRGLICSVGKRVETLSARNTS